MPRITRPPPQARLGATREEEPIPAAGLRLTRGTNALAYRNINRAGLIYHTHINRLIFPALQSTQIINKTQTNRKNPCFHRASMRFSTRDGAKKYHVRRYANALITLFVQQNNANAKDNEQNQTHLHRIRSFIGVDHQCDSRSPRCSTFHLSGRGSCEVESQDYPTSILLAWLTTGS